MKSFVLALLCVLFALAMARESQISALEDLLEQATSLSADTEGGFQRVSQKPILEMLEKMRGQLAADLKRAVAAHGRKAETRERLQRKEDAELAQAEADKKTVLAKNAESKKLDQAAHDNGMKLMAGDKAVVAQMRSQLALLKRYNIPAGAIEVQLKAIEAAVKAKEGELRRALAEQDAARKRLADAAIAAINKEENDVKARRRENARQKVIADKALAHDKKSIADEHDLINKIEKIVTGKDVEERKAAEAAAREKARKAREAARKRREELERKQAAAAEAKRKAEVERRRRAEAARIAREKAEAERKAREAEARRKAEEERKRRAEAARRAAEAARRRAAAAHKKRQEEAARRAREAAARRAREAARRAAEARRRAEAARRAREAAQRRAREAARRRAEAARYVGYNSRIFLRSHHGRYLVAESNGHLNANRPHRLQWETFQPQKHRNVHTRQRIRYGDKLGLRTWFGRYVVAENWGGANANRGHFYGWETFTIYNARNRGDRGYVKWGDYVGFKSYHNRYLVAEHNGRANANRGHMHAWETFRIEKSRF